MAQEQNSDICAFTDLAILDYLMYQILQYRIGNPENANIDDSRTKYYRKAHTYLILASSLIKEIKEEFNGELPADELMTLRLELVKLVGWLLYNYKMDCRAQWYNGHCCKQHQLEGMKLAHDHLETLLKKHSFFPKHYGVLSMFLELKTQIVLLQEFYAEFQTEKQNLFEVPLELQFVEFPDKFVQECQHRASMFVASKVGSLLDEREESALKSPIKQVEADLVISSRQEVGSPTSTAVEAENFPRDAILTFNDLRELYSKSEDEFAALIKGDHPDVSKFKESIDILKGFEKSIKQFNEAVKDPLPKVLEDLNLGIIKESPKKSLEAASAADSSAPKVPAAPSSDQQQRKKRPFSAEEEENVVAGFRKFGPNWRAILNSYSFNNRSPVDLKDKFRNLVKARKVSPAPQ